MRKIKRWRSRHLTDRRGSGTRSDTSQASSWPHVNLSAAGSLGRGGTGGGGGRRGRSLAASTTVLVCGSQISALAMIMLSSADLMGLL